MQPLDPAIERESLDFVHQMHLPHLGQQHVGPERRVVPSPAMALSLFCNRGPIAVAILKRLVVLVELGHNPGEIERGDIHDSFEVREPGGTLLLFNSSHASDLPL